MRSNIQIYQPDPKLFGCRLCEDIFKKPVTLMCGHTFCYSCLYNVICKQKQGHVQSKCSGDVKQKQSEEDTKKQVIAIPLCPSCNYFIFRPIKQLCENKTISNLISRFGFKSVSEHPSYDINEDSNTFNVKCNFMFNCLKANLYPLPDCQTQVEFETDFFEEMKEMQADNNFIIMRWKDFPQDVGLKGQILRAELLQNKMTPKPHYIGVFYGVQFVSIVNEWSLHIKKRNEFNSNLSFDPSPKCQLSVCTAQPITSENIQPLDRFNNYFQEFDQIVDPNELHQLARLLNLRVLQTRNDPERIIYCAMRSLKLSNDTMRVLVACFDDQYRINEIDQFINSQKMLSLCLSQIFRLNIPGNISSRWIFALIFLLFSFHLFQN